ncbi:hypothetical protein HJFPF1_00693 [Paramyrothecium foliicola]|nr:hypothetical protein HJFPF1_00693 [Paramyrothecium foliicola]
MAQGQVVLQHPATHNVPQVLTDREQFEVQQYNRIVQIRDSIVAGKHPNIKLPPGAVAALQSPSLEPAVQSTGHSASQATAEALSSIAPQNPPRLGKVEINPIFLEKSDDLIRAELQLQRQRIERLLKEEVDQRRAAKHTQAEPLSELDLSDVLAKALTIVQATAAPLPLVDDNLTANLEAASDSFDDNTFYSSQHDTPESHLTSRVRNESEDFQAVNISGQPVTAAPNRAEPASEPRADAPQQGNQALTASVAPPGQQDGTNNNQAPGSRAVQVPGLNNYPDRGVSSTGPSHLASGEQSEDSGPMDVEYQGGNIAIRTSQQLRDAYAAIHPPSPLARDFAPANVRPPQAVDANVSSSRGAPAQVTALRHQASAATSPESSPQGPNGRQANKKGKKKKRKADRQAPDNEPAPYIKPEPRSPSPIAGPAFLRPNKRQKHDQLPAGESNVAEPSFARTTAPVPQHDAYDPLVRPDDRVARGYGQASVQPQRVVSTSVLGETRYGPGFASEHEASNEAYVRPYASPRAHPYASNGGHPPRSVAQHVIVDDPYREPQRLGRDPYEVSRMSVRPDNGPLVAAPRPPPTRIYVDAFGREYIEPPPVRHSVAPSAAPGDPEIFYERVRAPSRYPEPLSYEDSAVYPRSTSTYSMPRRIVTQPEYLAQDYRDPRHREYSTARAMGSSGEFVQVMAPPARRIIEERPREYVSRAASVRPAETVRYELPPDYGRIQSVRPEGPIREYSAVAHHEPRRQLVQPYSRDFSSRPADQHVVRREYSTRPMEQYYDPQVPGGEVAFIERPRGATQEIVYADDMRRDLYR